MRLRAASRRDLECVAFARELFELLREQRIGALHFLVAHQEALDALGDLVDGAGVRHGGNCRCASAA